VIGCSMICRGHPRENARVWKVMHARHSRLHGVASLMPHMLFVMFQAHASYCLSLVILPKSALPESLSEALLLGLIEASIRRKVACWCQLYVARASYRLPGNLFRI